MKISACIIAKVPSGQLTRAIESVRPLVDEVIVVFNGPKAPLSSELPSDILAAVYQGANAQKACPPAKGCGCKKGDLLDFAKLRNYSFSLATGDWVFWLDSDDELEYKNENALRDLVSRPGKFRYGFLYDYGGQDIWNVRLVPQKTFPSKWEYPVHEALVTEGFGAEFEQAPGLVIKHKRTAEGQKESVARNLRICLHWEKAKRWAGDARFQFYFGQALRNLDRKEEAIARYAHCVELSGVPDEKYIAAELVSKLLISLGKYREALTWAYRALEQWPERANGFIQVGVCFYHLASHTGIYGYWVCSVKYFKLSSELVVSSSLIPMEKIEDIAFEAAILYNVSLNNSGDVVEALHVAERANAFRADGRLQANMLIYRAYLAKNRLLEVADELTKTYGQGSTFADASVREAFGELAKRSPVGLAAAVRSLPRSVRSIALVCGYQWQPWNPAEGAPGGSEIAIVELSKRFAKRGYDVTVFTDPLLGEHPIVHDGVRWAGTAYCESGEEFDVVIGWRGLDRVEGAKGAKRVLWLHDMHVQFVTPKRLAMTDVVVVNSAWHADQVRSSLPGKRIEVLGAGLDPSRFSPEKWPKTLTARNLRWCVWASSWDRGLNFMLEMWPRVRERVKDAHLHVLYGCDGSLNMARKNNDKAAEEKFLGWKKLAQETPGVVLHGRVPPAEYDTLLMCSGVWAYPIPAAGNNFGETFGVTAAEAICAGLRAVVSPRGALAEVASPYAFRQVYGARETEEYKANFCEAIAEAMTYGDEYDTRQVIAEEARLRFDWDRVVDRWEERIFK
jgi:glycosyltransferase involved in cell wall biosynthesis/tetratricopeptide (TPR) repeat protein